MAGGFSCPRRAHRRFLLVPQAPIRSRSDMFAITENRCLTCRFVGIRQGASCQRCIYAGSSCKRNAPRVMPSDLGKRVSRAHHVPTADFRWTDSRCGAFGKCHFCWSLACLRFYVTAGLTCQVALPSLVAHHDEGNPP